MIVPYYQHPEVVILVDRQSAIVDQGGSLASRRPHPIGVLSPFRRQCLVRRCFANGRSFGPAVFQGG
jgi:hypothetical protein